MLKKTFLTQNIKLMCLKQLFLTHLQNLMILWFYSVLNIAFIKNIYIIIMRFIGVILFY